MQGEYFRPFVRTLNVKVAVMCVCVYESMDDENDDDVVVVVVVVVLLLLLH